MSSSEKSKIPSPLFSPLSSLLAMTGEIMGEEPTTTTRTRTRCAEIADTFLDGVIGSVHEWGSPAVGRKGSRPSMAGTGEGGGSSTSSTSDLTSLRDEDVNWKQRCEELESSLQRFRNQAARIREVLREKLADLERRVVEAERRAEAAEQRAQLMEDRLVESSVQSSGDVIVSSSPSPSSLLVEPHQLLSSLISSTGSGATRVSPSTSTNSSPQIPPPEVINVLENEVEEQKKLRIQDAKQVEAKAAKIKEWVTNKLKELEQQNQHLREQNQKCNEQLELLRNRLVQLSQLNPTRNKLTKDHRNSTEDSSRGSFEDRCCESDDGYPSESRELHQCRDCSSPSSNSICCQLANDLNNCHQRNNHRNHHHIRNASFDASFDQLYAAVDYTKKRSQLKSAPPRVKIERKKYDNHVSIVSSVASDEFCDLDVNSAYDPILDAVGLDNSTTENGSPLPTPRTGKKMHHSRVTDSAPGSPSAAGGTGGPSSRSASPATRGGVRNHKLSPVDSKNADGYGSLDRNLTGQRKVDARTATTGGKRTIRTDNETHDYAEIYTPAAHHDLPEFYHSHHHRHHHRSVCGVDEDDEKPPTPPLHRFPSWESRIYDVAVNGITVPESLQIAPTGSPNNNSKPNQDSYSNGAFPDLNIPVYATVKGRASQIRSVPFTGESSDSSDNEDTRVTTTNSSHTTSGETESSLSTGGSPSKAGSGGGGKNSTSSSALHPPSTPIRQGSASPTKSVKRDTSVESVLSDDYAIPPDAISSDALSIDSAEPQTIRSTPNFVELSPKKESLEKSGYLTKLGGKLKTWRRRWFVLKNGTLSYFKSQNDVFRKPQGLITLDDVCRVTRAEGAATFEISTGKRTYYLTAESVNTMEEWIKVLQNVLRRNATRLLLSKEDNRPTMEGWLTKVKHGHSRRCWCVLIGRMFLYFKTPNETTPLGQINMRDARVEEVSHVSDSDEEEDHDDTMSKSEHTVGIFPNHQGPTYLLMATKQELDSWLYHLTVVSSGDNFVGTQFEQLVTKLMEVDGDENSVLWRHPILLYSKENIAQPLTTLPSDTLQIEATKLFKSIQLFISVPLETSGIDYHIALAQNSLQQCLVYPELQNELFCQLIKQTSRHSHQRLGVQQLLLCATQSLFLCDTSSVEKTSNNSSTSPGDRPTPSDSKLNPAPFVFIQGWQLLALTVTLFVPKNRTLWFLRAHLQRNAESKTEGGKYATFCQRALERTLLNGARECKPSRMEVLSILLKNPYHHSLPHSIPVHYLNGTYQVVGFDGSSTVEEFIHTLNAEAGIRDSSQSGFALYSDDPIDKSMEHCLQNSAKLCDVISKWEQALREKHLGKFENTKVLKLTYKNRLCFRQLLKAETDRERILTAYQINEDMVQGRFPLSWDLSIELAALMAQIEFGDYNADKPRGSTGTPANPQHQLQQVIERFFPQRYRDPPNEKLLRHFRQNQERIREKWIALKGRNVLDCVRIYLNCARKWSFCGSRLYSAKLRGGDQQSVWLAVTEDSIALLDCVSMQPLVRYPYSMVVTFGGCRDDFMLVISQQSDMAVSERGGDSSTIGRSEAHSATATTEKLLFSMPKPKILELTLLIADYMNALGRPTTVPPSPQASTLSRLEKIRAKIRATTNGSSCASPMSLRASSLVLTTAVGSVSCASTLCSNATTASTLPGPSHFTPTHQSSDPSKAVSSVDLHDGGRSLTRTDQKKRVGRDST